jgi:hypothetical protein
MWHLWLFKQLDLMNTFVILIIIGSRVQGMRFTKVNESSTSDWQAITSLVNLSPYFLEWQHSLGKAFLTIDEVKPI